MKKKRIIIVLIGLVFLIILRFVLASHEQKDPYNSLHEHQNKVKEFVSNEKGTEPKTEIKTNEGGYTGVLIKNKQVLQQAIGTDGMLATSDKITESLNHIQKIYQETKGLSESDLSEYFNQNKDTINSTLGIVDEAGFKKLLSELSFMNNSDSLKEAEIQDNSVAKSESEVKFSLSIKSSSGKEQIFKITALINANNPKDVKLTWN